MRHFCHYCKTAPCPPRYLCCGGCWSYVPRPLGAKLYAAFDPAQCSGKGKRPLPTGEWMIAADACLIEIGVGQGLRASAGDQRFDFAAVAKLTRAANYALAASAPMTSEGVRAYMNGLIGCGSAELDALLARAVTYGPWPVDLRERGLLASPAAIAAFAPVM